MNGRLLKFLIPYPSPFNVDETESKRHKKKEIMLAQKKLGEDSFINVWTTLAGVLIIFTLDWVWPPTPLCPLHKLGTAQCCSIKLALCSTQVTKERGTIIDWTTHKSTTKHKVSQKVSFFSIQNWVILQLLSWDSMRQGWNRVEHPITHCVTLVLKSLFHVPVWNGWRARGFIFHMCGHFVLKVFAFHCSCSIHYTAHRSISIEGVGWKFIDFFFTLSSSSLRVPSLCYFFSSESAKKREWRLRNKADLKMERGWIK